MQVNCFCPCSCLPVVVLVEQRLQNCPECGRSLFKAIELEDDPVMTNELIEARNYLVAEFDAQFNLT